MCQNKKPMKYLSLLLTAYLLLTTGAFAQAPQVFNYQAVLRDTSGQVIASENVNLKISILKGSAEGAEVFTETHATQTNEYGLVNLRIGSVSSMEDIAWGEDAYFIQVELNGVVMGASQLLSVPYALYSKGSADAFSGDYNDLVNKPDMDDLIHFPDPQQGDMLVYDGNEWQSIPLGEEGSVLTIQNGMPMWLAPLDPDVLIDVDGNVYPVLEFGQQEWMGENLRTTRYRDGTTIPTGLSHAEWVNTSSGAYAVFPHDNWNGINSEEEMIEAVGLLYNWNAAVDPRGLCPDGWRVPSKEDWVQLKNHIISNYDDIDETNAGNSLKSCRQVNSPLGGDCNTTVYPRWNDGENEYGTDNFDFGAHGSGARFRYGSYYYFGRYAHWWTTTPVDPNEPPYVQGFAYNYTLAYFLGNILEQMNDKIDGFSVRCVRDR